VAATPPRVLVAYATKHGTTTEIAEEIGATLRSAGLGADVRPARAVKDVEGYDAVVLGSAVYMARWRPEVRAFARRHAHALRERPVWLFSSGPLDADPDPARLRSAVHAERVADQLGAREHVTFGGALDPGARGFVTRRMVEAGLAGDFRDHEQIRDFARRVAAALAGSPAGG
jgi:menaquinone-dependent protoporphyrinogen oxidase